MYEVSAKMPIQEWPGYRWARLTPRPIGIERAKRLADGQNLPATVALWMTADVAYRNAAAEREWKLNPRRPLTTEEARDGRA